MWSCSFSPFSGGWWGGFFPGGIFSLLLWGLVVLLIVYLAIRLFKALAGSSLGLSQDRHDFQTILKERFAGGEISQEEFIKMKQILSQS
jgi:putative membrane protein